MFKTVLASLIVLTASGLSASDSAKGTINKLVKADSVRSAADDSAKEKKAAMQQEAPKVMMTKSGVGYIDHAVGKGKEVAMGDKTSVHYTLWLDEGDGKRGKKIDSSHDRNQAFVCTIGTGLIQGWSDGMVGMKPGGTRELRVPSALGYGARGAGGAIPPNANLIFEIQFLEYQK